MNKFYTGIGSRSTPSSVMAKMTEVGFSLANEGYVLRSGKAEGADKAFQLGVQESFLLSGGVKPTTEAEIYIPWPNFKGGINLWDSWDKLPNNREECYKIASEIHPVWGKLSQGARKLHGRNVCQILGNYLPEVEASDFVLYYAEEDRQGNPKGGTRTAVLLAKKYNIPTINMLHEDWEDKLKGVL